MPTKRNTLDELNDLIKTCQSGTPIPQIIEQLNLSNDRTTSFQVVGAIRLAGYKVERNVSWDKQLKRSVSTSVLIK
jgi:hypothetical protein